MLNQGDILTILLIIIIIVTSYIDYEFVWQTPVDNNLESIVYSTRHLTPRARWPNRRRR